MPDPRILEPAAVHAAHACQLWFATPTAALLDMELPPARPRTRRQVEQATTRALLRHCAPAPHQAVSLSHSHGHVALGVAGQHVQIGVDLESMRPRDVAGIAELSFDSGEARWLASLPPAERLPRFYEFWTLKEACAKALQIDLLTALRRCRFQLDSSGWHGDLPSALEWSAVVFAPRPEFRLTAVRMSTGPGLYTPVLPETHGWPEPDRAPWEVVAQFSG